MKNRISKFTENGTLKRSIAAIGMLTLGLTVGCTPGAKHPEGVPGQAPNSNPDTSTGMPEPKRPTTEPQDAKMEKVTTLRMSAQEAESFLVKQIRTTYDNSVYKPVSSQELDRFEQLIQAMLANQTVSPESWSTAGFQITSLEIAAKQQGGFETYWFIAEKPTLRYGRGLFLVRRAANTLPIHIQAPHGRSDLKTEDIAARLCLEHPVRSCSWNTVNRKAFDIAHTDDSSFSRLTKVAVALDSKSVVVQLHGFENEKRKSDSANDTGIIMSSWRGKQPSSGPKQGAHFSKFAPMALTKVFGRDIFELGATTNSQGKLVRQANRGGFLHVEMNRNVRNRLSEDAQMRNVLFTEISDFHAGVASETRSGEM